MILCLGASKHADALFQDVLKRKDDADTMRNALSVLHRFRSLFSLPQIIEKNISQVLAILELWYTSLRPE